MPGFFVAAGLSLNGFGGAGGIGKAMAELVIAGESELDLQAYRPWRFGAAHRDPRSAAETAREAYRYYYRLRYPLDSDVLGRPRRTSALHERMQDAGAVFAVKNGWERADYCQPGQPWRRAGEEQRAFGWAEPPYAAVLAEESAAHARARGHDRHDVVRQDRGRGSGALRRCSSACCDAHVDRAAGRCRVHAVPDERGGIVADVTVTRLAEERFRVVTGAGGGRLRPRLAAAASRDGDAPVELRDETDALCVIGMWGPHARDVLQAVTRGRRLGGRLPVRAAAASLRVGRDAPSGLSASPTSASSDMSCTQSRRGGCRSGIAWPPPARATASGRSATACSTPCAWRRATAPSAATSPPATRRTRPGSASASALGRKGEFIGRAGGRAAAPSAARAPPAHAARRRRRATSCVYGGEAVLAGGAVVGRVRSAAYGFTVGKMIASAYLPPTLAPGAPLAVEALGRRGPAEIAPDVLYDPENARAQARRACGAAARAESIPAMLDPAAQLRCCDRDLPPESDQARICTYECTFCADCAENRFGDICPNCGGTRAPADPPAGKLLEGSGRRRSGSRRRIRSASPETPWPRSRALAGPSAERRRLRELSAIGRGSRPGSRRPRSLRDFSSTCHNHDYRAWTGEPSGATSTGAGRHRRSHARPAQRRDQAAEREDRPRSRERRPLTEYVRQRHDGDLADHDHAERHGVRESDRARRARAAASRAASSCGSAR